MRLTEEQYQALAARMREVSGRQGAGEDRPKAGSRQLQQRNLTRRLRGKKWEAMFALQLDLSGIHYEREYRFVPDRRFRFDFRITDAHQVAVEIG